jgi:hypothetical protein
LIKPYAYRNCPRDKYWYAMPEDKPGYELPRQFKDKFDQKQIVCIEYDDLNDKQQREIFRVSSTSTLFSALSSSNPTIYPTAGPIRSCVEPRR